MPGNGAALSAVSGVEFVPGDPFRPLILKEVFGRDAPLELDVGSGAGAFLMAMAERFPERNFLGIERLLGRVRGTCNAAARRGLQNVRVLRIESSHVLRELIPRASVSICHIAFPDPWPKRRHWPRRLINPPFIEAVAGALIVGGELRIKTDDAPYFAKIAAVIAGERALQKIPWPDDPEYPRTNFERRFLAQGLPIYSLRLRKV